jgi:hypothetical protein
VQKRFLILFCALSIFMLVAGCTAPAPSPTNASQHNLSEQKNVTEPILVQTPYPLVTTLVPDTTSTQNQTLPTDIPSVTPSLRKGDTTEPYVSNLGFKDYYLATDIPGCDMKELFPAFANDPAYGIEQPVPKLSTLSAAEMRTFIRDHTLGSNENSAFKGSYSCRGVSMSPDWNFAEIHATITPRNARPATYEISLIMKSRGRNITLFTTQENLTPDQTFALVRYIPMKLDEMELLDTPYVTFTLLPAPVLTTPVTQSPLQPEIVDSNALVFTPYANLVYSIRYPEQWTVEENAPAHATVFTSTQGQITYSLTTTPHETNAGVVKTDLGTYLNDVAGDYPGYSPDTIMRDFGRCSFADTSTCMQYSVYLPDGRYAKKVFVDTAHYSHVFRIQCPDNRCKNLGEYMTNSITVKDTRSN